MVGLTESYSTARWAKGWWFQSLLKAPPSPSSFPEELGTGSRTKREKRFNINSSAGRCTPYYVRVPTRRPHCSPSSPSPSSRTIATIQCLKLTETYPPRSWTQTNGHHAPRAPNPHFQNPPL
ncbi:hypothetical protein HYALB_00001496 [Hymenoscyphus albidus]|uniref:Uncharacterized protein n=1 Tax=Hymenoscyphus albidus TaxID=595503 RepID=A0A9N9L905_9HELO|nr:hypothetical protein HYALB_00001496 [Hymenoscyphus albidus]